MSPERSSPHSHDQPHPPNHQPLDNIGDRAVPRRPGQPGRDRRLHRPRPHRRAAHPARPRNLGDRPGPGGAADRGGPPPAGRAGAVAGAAGLGERLFLLWAGLKGAVPILLGTFLFTAAEPDATRLYGIIVVVVTFSVVVQGGLVPTVAARLRVPMRPIQPEPWSLGVRLRHEPSGLRRYLVAAGAPADGCTIGDLAVGEDVWISVVIRHGHLLPVRGSTRLRAGDEVLALTDPEHPQNLAASLHLRAEAARHRRCTGLMMRPRVRLGRLRTPPRRQRDGSRPAWQGRWQPGPDR